MVRPWIEDTPSHLFFDGSCPFYVNRVSESFELQIHTHEFMEICYIGEGSGTQYIGNTRIPVSRGDLFLLPIGTSHVVRPRSPKAAPLVVYNFLYMPEESAECLLQVPGLSELRLAPAWFGLVPGAETDWMQFRDSTGKIHSIMTEAHEEYRLRRLGSTARLHSLLVMLMVELERSRSAGSGTAEGDALPRSDKPMKDALRFIQGAYAGPISVGQAAEAAGLSERHFHRRFRQSTGITFNRYVQNLRIARSKELLDTTRLSVTEVAEAVGYQDKGYFLELFRRRTGQTPRAFRNRGSAEL